MTATTEPWLCCLLAHRGATPSLPARLWTPPRWILRGVSACRFFPSRAMLLKRLGSPNHLFRHQLFFLSDSEIVVIVIDSLRSSGHSIIGRILCWIFLADLSASLSHSSSSSPVLLMKPMLLRLLSKNFPKLLNDFSELVGLLCLRWRHSLPLSHF